MSEQVDDQAEKPLSEDLIRQLSNDEITGSLITPDKIYLDVAMLKDLYIGTLLSFLYIPYSDELPKLREDEGYQYLMSRLPEYRKRDFNDMLVCFPKYGITTEMVHERMYDPAHSDMIFACSPGSAFLRTLWSQLAINVNHSTVAGKREPIVLTVNTYPLKLNKENTDLLGAFIVAQFGVTVIPICISPETYPVDQFVKFDEYYIYHYKPFSDRKDIQQLFYKLLMLKKWLFVPRYFGYKFNPLLNLKNAITRDVSQISAAIQFKYLTMDLVSVPLPVEPT